MITYTLNDTSSRFRNAYREKKSPIWKALEKKSKCARSRYPEVNIEKLDNITKEGDIVIVPGKVLGSGVLKHKIILSTFAISITALKKIVDSGGKVISINDLVEQYPDGKGVRIIG